MPIAVAIVYDAWKAEGDSLSNALKENLGTTPVRGQSQGFAGPNDVVQWVASYADWQAIAIGLSVWLGGKVGDDVYSFLKERVLRRFGQEKKKAEIGNLPGDVAKVVLQTQRRGGDVVLTVQEEPVLEGEFVLRSLRTITIPPLKDDGGVALATYVVEFALSIEAINNAGGNIPSELIEIIHKSDGEPIAVLRTDAKRSHGGVVELDQKGKE